MKHNQPESQFDIQQINHHQSPLHLMSEILEMKSLKSQSSVNSSPEIILKDKSAQVEKNHNQAQKFDEKININQSKQALKAKQEEIYLKEYQSLSQNEEQTEKKEVNLLQDSQSQSKQLECVESIKIQLENKAAMKQAFLKFQSKNPQQYSQIINSRNQQSSLKRQIQPKKFNLNQQKQKQGFSPFKSKKDQIIQQKLLKNRNNFFIACQRVNKTQIQSNKKSNKHEKIQEVKCQPQKQNLSQNLQFQTYFEKCKFEFCGIDCIGGFPISMICVEKNCENQAEHCSNFECKICVKNHKNCQLKFTYNMFKQSLKKNVNRQKNTMQIVYQSYASIIKEIKFNQEKAMKLLCVQGVNQCIIKNLEERFQIYQRISFKGKQVLNVIQMIGNQSEHNPNPEKKTYKKMKQNEQDIKQKLTKQMRLLFQPSNSAFCQIDSHLLKNKNQIKFVLEQLERPLDMKLLYRASENQFSIKKFHQLCDQSINTFTVIKTEFGKLIGGYTPLKWNDKYGRDRSNKSFLLAINLKERLDHIKHGESAIYCSNQLGPSFGGLFQSKDIEIYDEDGRLFCNTNFPNAYNWKKFFAPSQDSWRFLTGVQNGKRCKVIDYEVFQVISDKII